MESREFLEDLFYVNENGYKKLTKIDYDAFVNKFSQKYLKSNEESRQLILQSGIFNEYEDILRKQKLVCGDCGKDKELTTHSCNESGDFGCGKGSWCRKHKYKLCDECANIRRH